MDTNNAEFSPAQASPVGTGDEPIHKIDATVLSHLDEILSAQIPVTVGLKDGTKMPFADYDETIWRDSQISLLADDDGDEARPKTRAALETMAENGVIRREEIESVLAELMEMGGRTDASVLTNVCKSDWGEAC